MQRNTLDIMEIILARVIGRICGWVVMALLLCGCQERPNFVVIVADDLGYMDVGSYNAETFYETPNIDRLAREGMLFTDAYAAAPVCSPTRASIMTGRYPARLKTTDWFGAPQPETASTHFTGSKPLRPASYFDTLPHAEVTVAEALGGDGYRTFYAGKWHLGSPGSYLEDHGFDINRGGWERGGPYGPGRYFPPYNNPRLEDGPAGEHLPDRLARETVAFIQNGDGTPFLAFLSFYSVHTPLMTRPDLEAKYAAKAQSLAPVTWGTEGERRVCEVQNHAIYAGMVEAMDQAVGKVLMALDSLGLARNTVVIFTSDNGGLSTSEGHPTSNLPLRAGKGWMYEGGIRVPFIVRWPDRVQASAVTADPVISNDILPTLVDIAGGKAVDLGGDGSSLVPLLLRSESLSREALYWHYPHYGNQGGSPSAAVRRGRWKLIEFFETGHTELYDLEADASEQNDLSGVELGIAADLYVSLQDWQLSVDAWNPTSNHAVTNAEREL